MKSRKKKKDGVSGTDHKKTVGEGEGADTHATGSLQQRNDGAEEVFSKTLVKNLQS